MKRIAIEEHFITQDCLNYLRSRKEYPKVDIVRDDNNISRERIYSSPTKIRYRFPDVTERLVDLGEGRIREMNKTGITMQVLSLYMGMLDLLDEPDAISMARQTNDELSVAVKRHPDRFAGFAAVARHNPEEAARELDRAVTELGLVGLCVNSHFNGEYLDLDKYSVLLETAERLKVPIYIHPKAPSPEMLKPYLVYPGLPGAMFGFAADTGLHAMRLICTGVFDRYPDLKIILGHMGETLPFLRWRMDNIWKNEGVVPAPDVRKFEKLPGQYIKDNFFVTTSGVFSQPPLLCTYMELGAERILFAVDYPYESNLEAVKFIEAASICEDDKEKICHHNAERLLLS